LIITEKTDQPSFALTSEKIAVARLTTIEVALAHQTASDSVNFPDRENAEVGAGDKRGGDHNERDPANYFRIEYVAAVNL